MGKLSELSDWLLNKNQIENNIKNTARDLTELIRKDYTFLEQNEIIKIIRTTILNEKIKELNKYKDKVKELEEIISHFNDNITT